MYDVGNLLRTRLMGQNGSFDQFGIVLTRLDVLGNNVFKQYPSSYRGRRVIFHSGVVFQGQDTLSGAFDTRNGGPGGWGGFLAGTPWETPPHGSI